MPYATKKKRRKHYHKNKDKINKKRREYCRKNREHINKTNKAYRDKNRDKVKKWYTRYNNANKEKMRKYKIKNREKILLKASPYRKGIDTSHCWICGLTKEESLKKSKKRISVHHIDGNKNNNCKENLIAVCTSCHIGIHNSLNPKRGNKR